MTIKRFFLLFAALCFLLSLGLLLWRYASSVEAELSVPVSLENLPDDLIVVSQPPKDVEVSIQGQKLVMAAFLEEEHACRLDLTRATVGLFTIPVAESDLLFPENVSISQIKPTSFTLRIEAKLTKTVPVVVTLTDNPAPGYKATLTLATPSYLQIVGPKKVLDEIEELATRPVSIEGASESLKKEIAIDLPSGVNTGGAAKGLVTAQINIEENVIVRRFENIPVEGRETVLPVTITPPDIHIDVKGTENDLAGLSVGNDIEVYVDLKDLSPGVYVRRAQITLPVGSTLVAATPEVFTVTIGN